MNVARQEMNVAAVASSEVVRSGLAQMLDQAAGVDEYAVFEPREFSAEAPEDAIQVLILSYDVLILWSASGSGLGESAWAADLAAVARKNGILVVFVLPGSELQRAASGVIVPCHGVLGQDALTTDSLRNALKRLASGERFVMEPAAQVPLQSRQADPGFAGPLPLVMLTARERQVLELLVEGLSNKQIGRALALSEHSAKRLVAIVLSKLNCPNRTQAVAVALRDGLITPTTAATATRGPSGPHAAD